MKYLKKVKISLEQIPLLLDVITKIILGDDLVKNQITIENNENVTITNTNVSYAVKKIVYSEILLRCREFMLQNKLTHKSDNYDDLLKIIKFINNNQNNDSEKFTNHVTEKNKLNLNDSKKILFSYDNSIRSILNIIDLISNLMKILNLVLDTLEMESRIVHKYLDEFYIMINYLSQKTNIFHSKSKIGKGNS